MKLLVVGGGPAGASAAITARKLGLEVTLLDAVTFPRFRPGETLHPGIEPLLNELEPSGSLLKLARVRHPGVWVHWGERHEFVPFGSDWLGYQIDRMDLDAGLLALARDLGVEVLLGVEARFPVLDAGRVTGVESNHGRFDADVVIDASGAESWLRHSLRIGSEICSPRLIAQYGYVGGVCSLGESPRMRTDGSGWTWLAYLGENRYHWTRVMQPAFRKPRTWHPPEYEGMRILKCGAADVTWRISNRLAGPGWYLCGEAAGILDPSSSHGVLRSVMSGMFAAKLTAATMAGTVPEVAASSSYQEWFQASFRHDVQEMSQAYSDAGLFGFDDTRSESR